MPQTATTGSLANAQRTVIAAVRYTEEHNAPAMALIEKLRLKQGEKTVTVPKVGQMSVYDLVDGQDIVDEEEIGMTTTDLTSAEVGAKVIITDKLVRQSQPAVFSMIGRQLGDGFARKQDTDVHALYTGLNGGTTFGATTKLMTFGNVAAAIGKAKGAKFGSNLYILHHPYAVYALLKTMVATPGTTYPIPDGPTADLLKNFWSGIRPINNVPIYEDGNVDRTTVATTVGVIAARDALVVLVSLATRTERQRDASLRATELVMVSDYGVFELDDAKGAALTFDSVVPSDTA